MLLLTLLCAGQIYGMEPLYPKPGLLAGSWENLPTEVQSLIMTAVAQSGNNLDNAIKNIVRFSKVNKELNNMINLNDLQGFTKIVHILADKFNDLPQDIAKAFHTSVAERYVQLADSLVLAIDGGDLEKTKQLISEGADPNFYNFLEDAISNTITKKYNIKIIQLLLNNGANPYALGLYFETPLEYLNSNFNNSPEYEQIKTLLENAMKKYQQ